MGNTAMSQKAPTPFTPPLSVPPGRLVTPSVCSRVLLYTRGMDLDPLFGLELALQSLRRADAGGGDRDAPLPPAPDRPLSDGETDAAARAALVSAMGELHALLRENNIGLHITTPDGGELRSAPPMNRKPMIAEEMDITPIRTALKKLFRKVSGSGSGASAGKGRSA